MKRNQSKLRYELRVILAVFGFIIFVCVEGCVANRMSSKKPQIELGDLVVWFMLDKNEKKPDWTMRSDLGKIPLQWNKDGINYNYRGFSWVLAREGKVRVAINNKIFWVLKSQKEELKWNVALEGTKFGVEKVTFWIENECLGVGASGCDFQWEEIFQNITSKNMKTIKVCMDKTLGGGFQTLYEIKAEGKQDVYVMFGYTVGSGGATNWVELWWKLPNITENNETACKHLKKWSEFYR